MPLDKSRPRRLGTPSLKSLPEDLCSGFLCPEKIYRAQPDLNPRTLDLEAITLPRDYRDRLAWLVDIRDTSLVKSKIFLKLLCTPLNKDLLLHYFLNHSCPEILIPALPGNKVNLYRTWSASGQARNKCLATLAEGVSFIKQAGVISG